jgi:MoaA/NifB/PqqE/SkfB family radical SAM enzyme
MRHVPAFPPYLSLTLTQACSLRCRMCAQWGPHGYLRQADRRAEAPLDVDDWQKLIASIPTNSPPQVLLRGGEPLELPGFPRLLEAIRARGLSVSIDSNGVLLERLADELAAIGGFHVTVSLDGPPQVHDAIRGVPGTYERARRGVDALRTACARARTQVSFSLNFTLGPDNLDHLAEFPDLARAWQVPVLCVVPRYWVDEHAGRDHERALAECGVAAWAFRGFPHDAIACEPSHLKTQLETFRERLGEIEAYPFLPLTDREYHDWLSRWDVPVGLQRCDNAWTLLDVQPSGDANFCVDFPDWTIGNVRESSLQSLWSGPRANAFRARLSQGLLPACHRCGSKYMSRQSPTSPEEDSPLDASNC